MGETLHSVAGDPSSVVLLGVDCLVEVDVSVESAKEAPPG